ncbi:GyrI-like domain-containing protein [Gulosibacter molinativorax]|uniref:AraC family transcriptional regulator n=1 Tax=Gulosibacter molinativorax TaxID=256821 RepID=A0ABT7C8F5_9MICO|nr:GyrI-like domain-containing protein [Gulosibacter molinativorax]MDJ1371483.1 AraC family transcriptional regulator [Gulosibacter molinativorax]QUY62423.1 Hypotetical protein [Gulosibacter molinativorax]
MSLSAIEFIDFPGSPTAVVRSEAQPTNSMAPLMDSSFTALGSAIQSGVFTPTGPAFSRYDTEFGATVDVEVGFAVAESLAAEHVVGDVTIIPSELPAGKLAITKYQGRYDGLGDAWGEFLEAVKAEGYELLMPYWEAYDTEPTPEMDPADLITGLAVLVRKA